jgi:hypothetical protein
LGRRGNECGKRATAVRCAPWLQREKNDSYDTSQFDAGVSINEMENAMRCMLDSSTRASAARTCLRATHHITQHRALVKHSHAWHSTSSAVRWTSSISSFAEFFLNFDWRGLLILTVSVLRVFHAGSCSCDVLSMHVAVRATNSIGHRVPSLTSFRFGVACRSSKPATTPKEVSHTIDCRRSSDVVFLVALKFNVRRLRNELFLERPLELPLSLYDEHACSNNGFDSWQGVARRRHH